MENGIKLTLAVLSAMPYSFRSCPVSVCQDEWTYTAMPNPRTDVSMCGRHCVPSYVCDPCHILSNVTAKTLDDLLGFIPANGMICNGNAKQYVMSLAVVNKIRDDNRTDGVINAELFAKRVREKWKFGSDDCENDIVIVFSEADRGIYTSVGKGTIDILTLSCTYQIQALTRDRYFALDKIGEGLLFIVKEYRRHLQEGTCNDNLWVIVIFLVLGSIGGIVLFVLAIVFVCCKEATFSLDNTCDAKDKMTFTDLRKEEENSDLIQDVNDQTGDKE